jgi:hypothetical protein
LLSVVSCLLSVVLCQLLSNKKRNYISTAGETQKEALRTCKTTDNGQQTTDKLSFNSIKVIVLTLQDNMLNINIFRSNKKIWAY